MTHETKQNRYFATEQERGCEVVIFDLPTAGVAPPVDVRHLGGVHNHPPTLNPEFKVVASIVQSKP